MTHPALVTLDHIDMLDNRFGTTPAREVFGYEPGWGVPSIPVDLASRTTYDSRRRESSGTLDDSSAT